MVTPLAALVLSQQQTIASPPVVWTGEHSKVVRQEVKIVSEPKEWRRTWLEHTGQKQEPLKPVIEVPEVDFKSYAVVVVFGGKQRQVSGFKYAGSELKGDILTLRYIPMVYGVGFAGPKPPADWWVGTPFGFYVVPNNFKTVRVEEGILRSKDKPVSEFRLVGAITVRPDLKAN